MASFRSMPVTRICLILPIFAALCAAQIPCRRSEAVSRCVEAPLSPPPDESVQLCAYRVCAFSFLKATQCDANFELRATHECSKEESFVATWRCEEGQKHRFVLLPVGCKGDECTDEVKACPCVGFVSKRTVMESVRLLQDDCETVKVTVKG